MKRYFLAGFLVIASACTDKAKEPYERAQVLDGSDDHLEEALASYRDAVAASPGSEYGNKAKERVTAIEKQLSVPPSTITRAWCARLRRRLEDRFAREALAKDPSRGESYVRQITGDFVANLQYACQRNEGKPTAGRWACLWNSTFDNYDQCDK